MLWFTGGAWGVPVRAAALLLSRRMPWLLLGLVVIAATLHSLYPWAMQPANKKTRGMARPAFVQTWLSPAFFIARLAIYGAVCWAVTRGSSLASKGRAAASLVSYAMVTTLASVFLLVSLVPGWSSAA